MNLGAAEGEAVFVCVAAPVLKVAGQCLLATVKIDHGNLGTAYEQANDHMHSRCGLAGPALLVPEDDDL